MTTLTFQYPAHTTKGGYLRLDQAMLDMGVLYNALVKHRQSSTSSHRRRFSLSIQNAHLTDLHRHDPTYNPYARRILEGTTRRLNKAYRTAFKYPEVGFPTTHSPHRNNTIEISEPSVDHLKIDPDRKLATVRIKGLPTLTFKTDHRLPQDQQPRVIQITRTSRRTNLNLIFETEPKPFSPTPLQSVGIDPGVKYLITTVDDAGNISQVPGLDDRQHRKTIRRLRRRSQRQRDAALKDGRAKFINQKRKNGQTKRRFRWEGIPSKTYLRVQAQLRRVEQKRTDSRKGLHHRITTGLVETYQHICIEDTQTRNMTRSAKGTAEHPGTNVRQKSGLNRTILFQGWQGIRAKLEYKSQIHQRELLTVPAANTSRTCSQCGYTAPGNRPSQSVFHCLECGYQKNADVNAAENIRRLGLTRPGSGQETSLNVPPEAPRGNKRNGKSVLENPGPSVRAAHTKADS